MAWPADNLGVAVGGSPAPVASAPTVAHDLLAAFEAEGVTVRALGGVAVHICSPSARVAPLARDYEDIDLVVRGKDVAALSEVLVGLDYEPAERFNSLHGHSRLSFDRRGQHLDVMVDRLEMCHTLDLRGRLTVQAETLPLADLLLSKLQIAELNRKDLLDIVALLLDHQFTASDDGINLPYVTDLLRRDWGWWRTASENLAKLGEQLDAVGLEPSAKAKVGEQITSLVESIDGSPKTARWRARGLIGERMRWREDPEEPVT